MGTKNDGIRKLEKLVKDKGAARVAVDLGCTVTTIYNLLNGAHPSLRVALAADRIYEIEPTAWGPFPSKEASK